MIFGQFVSKLWREGTLILHGRCEIISALSLHSLWTNRIGWMGPWFAFLDSLDYFIPYAPQCDTPVGKNPPEPPRDSEWMFTIWATKNILGKYSTSHQLAGFIRPTNSHDVLICSVYMQLLYQLILIAELTIWCFSRILSGNELFARNYILLNMGIYHCQVITRGQCTFTQFTPTLPLR